MEPEIQIALILSKQNYLFPQVIFKIFPLVVDFSQLVLNLPDFFGEVLSFIAFKCSLPSYKFSICTVIIAFLANLLNLEMKRYSAISKLC